MFSNYKVFTLYTLPANKRPQVDQLTKFFETTANFDFLSTFERNLIKFITSNKLKGAAFVCKEDSSLSQVIFRFLKSNNEDIIASSALSSCINDIQCSRAIFST